jgi:hypothetical protein
MKFHSCIIRLLVSSMMSMNCMDNLMFSIVVASFGSFLCQLIRDFLFFFNFPLSFWWGLVGECVGTRSLEIKDRNSHIEASSSQT